MKEGLAMKKHRLLVKAGLFLGGIWFAGVTVWMVFLWYQAPCVVSVDVRGRQMEMAEARAWMDAWNRNHKLPGIIGVTGWRWEQAEEIYAPDTGRKSKSGIISVCGNVSEGMSFAGRMISGKWNIAGEGVCLVSGELAGNLFGSYDVVGSRLRIGSREWEIGGVVESDGARMMIPAADGDVDWVEIWTDRRWGMRAVRDDLSA